MSSHARSREEERRVSVRTLVIASAASAMAAVITSQFWIRGTPIAAAVTPVIVTLVSELLHRPTQRITERFTAETAALAAERTAPEPETDALPEAAGAGPPPRSEEYEPRPAREPPDRGPPARGQPESRVYGSRSASRGLPWKRIITTAVIAFILGAAALTLPELIGGQSLGRGDRNTTLLGGGSRDEKKEAPAEPEQSEPLPTERSPEVVPIEPTTPEQQPQETTPKAPEPSQPPAQSTPVPKAAPPAPQQP